MTWKPYTGPRLTADRLNELVAKGQPLFYKKREVAELFKVSMRTVDHWICQGKLDAMKIVSSTRITRESVEALIERGKQISDGPSRGEQ